MFKTADLSDIQKAVATLNNIREAEIAKNIVYERQITIENLLRTHGVPYFQTIVKDFVNTYFLKLKGRKYKWIPNKIITFEHLNSLVQKRREIQKKFNDRHRFQEKDLNVVESQNLVISNDVPFTPQVLDYNHTKSIILKDKLIGNSCKEVIENISSQEIRLVIKKDSEGNINIQIS
jgi:hypothetical protein